MKNLIKVMSYFATAVIFITAVSLFAMQGDDGRAYAADAVASISVTPIQSVLDISDRRTVYRYDDSTGKYSQISYYDVYDYDKIKLTVDYGGYSRSYTGSEITALTATLGAPLVISDGQSESVWGNGRHTVTYTLGTKSAKAVFTVAATKIKSLSVTPMYTINAICNVKGDYGVVADENGNISQRFEYDLAGYDYNVKIIYTDGTTVSCNAADLKQITGYEPKFSQGDKALSVGVNTGYCTVGGITAEFSFNVIENPVKSVSLYMTGGADSLTAGNDGYYAKKSDGSTYFRFIYNETKIRAKVVYTNGSTADYPIGELCAKLHGRLEISDTQSVQPWAAGTVTLPAKINGISTSLTLKITGAIPPCNVGGLVCDGSSDDSLTVSWDTDPFADGYTAEIYKGGRWVSLSLSSSGNKARASAHALQGGSKYKLRVRAYRRSGSDTLYSDYAYISAYTLPSGVGNITVSDTSASSVTLSLNSSSASYGYTAEIYKGGQWTALTVSTGTSTVSCTASSLQSGAKYKFRVRAYMNADGEKLYSEYAYISVYTLINETVKFYKAEATKNTVTISWYKGSCDAYTAEVYKDGQWKELTVTVGNGTAKCTATALQSGSAYKFRIKGYKKSGEDTLYSIYSYISVNTLK
ncbi:fibronectin type III domain-containing protein [Leyella stercorea]|uniref:fibronectin type III domain-containing protein n=1 Tax=Leyella stercorea TaxID=363265 RepID=UPI002431C926|nr:fibronectin type III domain-containing protein [Leyella stercorea]